MKKILLAIAGALAVLIAVQFVRSHIEDRRHYITVDSVQLNGHMPDSYRATVHSLDTVYKITCTEYTDRRDGGVRVCRLLGVNEVIKFGTMGDMLVFFDHGNFNSWKIESEERR